MLNPAPTELQIISYFPPFDVVFAKERLVAWVAGYSSAPSPPPARHRRSSDTKGGEIVPMSDPNSRHQMGFSPQMSSGERSDGETGFFGLDFQIPAVVVRVLMVDVSLVAAAVREKAL